MRLILIYLQSHLLRMCISLTCFDKRNNEKENWYIAMFIKYGRTNSKEAHVLGDDKFTYLQLVSLHCQLTLNKRIKNSLISL